MWLWAGALALGHWDGHSLYLLKLVTALDTNRNHSILIYFVRQREVNPDGIQSQSHPYTYIVILEQGSPKHHLQATSSSSPLSK